MTDVSYEVLEKRVEMLLEEWGQCQRKTPAPWVKGYPSVSVEGRLMEDYGRRTKADKRRRWAWIRKHRKVSTGGNRHSVIVMAPERSDTESRGGKRTEMDWPEHIIALDVVLAHLPDRLASVAVAYYIAQHSTYTAAKVFRVDSNEIRKRLERIRWFVAGRIKVLDEAG